MLVMPEPLLVKLKRRKPTVPLATASIEKPFPLVVPVVITGAVAAPGAASIVTGFVISTFSAVNVPLHTSMLPAGGAAVTASGKLVKVARLPTCPAGHRPTPEAAVNRTGLPAALGTLAVKVKGPVPEEGSCQLTWARPSAPVVTGFVPLIVPLPSPTANVTVAPAIGVPPESFTTTDGTTLPPGDARNATALVALSTPGSPHVK